jgi:hypothetical protein
VTGVLILVVVALLIAIGLRQAVRGFAADVIDPEQLLGRTRPVDLMAFRNLSNPDEDAYLAAHLPRTALWQVRRARYSAASEYVHLAAHNAAILIRLGQSAKNSSEVRIREAGTKLLTVAVQTRMLAGIAIVQLQIARVLPWWQPSIRSVTESYTGARNALESVVIWQRPDLAGRLGEAV